jgi:prolyl 4-hydroxylase
MTKDLYSKLHRTMNLSDYVRVYDNAMPASLCQNLIKKFESDTQNQVQRDNVHMKFTEVNIIQADWFLEPIMKLALEYRRRYWIDCNINDAIINPKHTWEEIRMKRYLKGNNEEFRPHTDAWDLETCKRFLVYFWYLNDVDEGGETIFYRLDQPLAVKPRQGRLIMFPVNWQYLHAGLLPLSHDKYIIGGYLHYE